ncbi:MAG: transglutaminase-like cysteine peptidase [Afipia sp.]|jgi:predicted transglutaminase-like cysteine proteinase
MFSVRGQGLGLAIVASLLGMTVAANATGVKHMPASAAGARVLYASLGDTARSPIGWVEFCADNPRDCPTGNTQARDIVMTQTAWRDLVRVNRWVNDNIKPMTDMEHWGVVEKWSYPTDGYGDCEDYVLLKRKMLIDAGWPREALLITVVRDKKNEGHAVLTVKTDKGEFVLDNQNEDIVAWTETGYRFVKRQSQTDANVWVSLGDPRPAVVTASSR